MNAAASQNNDINIFLQENENSLNPWKVDKKKSKVKKNKSKAWVYCELRENLF